MKICKIIVSFVAFVAIAASVVGQPMVVYDTIPIRHGTNKLRLYRNAEKWFDKERGTKLIAKNWKERKLRGKGYFPYQNYVQIPDIYLSSHAAEKTKGSIVFSIEVSIQDSIIVTKFFNFLHEARYSEYGTMSFGRLMDYEKVPSGKCMEVEEWCNAVWADMKAWATYEVKNRAKRMIPNTLIRKRTYRVQEKDSTAEERVVQEIDPTEYLKLENYLLKDTEGKYADYNKDEEEIAAEKAAALAAAEEKAKKKAKKSDEEEFSEEDEYADSESAETEAVASEDSQPEEKPEKVEKSSASDDYDDFYDEEPEEESPKKSKEKKEKTPKEKKPKKSKSDYEDEYDDYDDY